MPQCQITVRSPHTEQIAESTSGKAQESPHAGFLEKKEARHDVQRPETRGDSEAQAGREDGQGRARGW